MIKPGLERITLLLQGTNLPWRAIHVAGTNGKGSVCAYLSAMLHKASIRTGRFTSPHLIDRWDCIRIDEKPVQESTFRQVESRVMSRNEQRSIGATEFELLTATAFEIFQQEKVQVGVVECGMGGRLDSTNVIENPLVTVITTIGLDHQAFLGDTLDKIAREKAGIIKTGSPCVAQATNEASVISVLTGVARDKNVDLHASPIPEWFMRSLQGDASNVETEHQRSPSGSDPGAFFSIQAKNKWAAYQTMALALPALGYPSERVKRLAPAMNNVEFPGRFQRINLMHLTGRSTLALLDGAHNDLGMSAIREYRNSSSKSANTTADTNIQPCTWVIACSDTKGDLFQIPDEDHVVISEFGPVDGMPWVKPKPVDAINIGRPASAVGSTSREPDVLTALKRASLISNEGPMIITGSLYLVSDVLRLMRDRESGHSTKS